ncbi:MAG: endonuclease V [Nanopusillaceae archaeon]
MINLNNFIKELINQIPEGKISTFKCISDALGSHYAIKYVASIYKKLECPWWRVVNESGIVNDNFQKKKLIEEGIEIINNKIDVKKYLFKDFKIKIKPLEYLRKIQIEMSKKISLNDEFEEIEYIGGVDIGYKNNVAKVVYVILDKNLILLKKYIFIEKIEFPYIPTFLSFREGEPIIKTFDKIDKIDILFVNGFGIAHPVKMGLASWIGVKLDIPTIGITKSLLYGKVVEDKIIDEKSNEILGYVIRKFNKKIYTSPGNKVSLKTCKELSERFWIKGNYPEPIRLADEISKKISIP